MTRVLLDRETLAKLHDIRERLELCDESGQILGYLTPVADGSQYRDLKPPVGEDELRRREREAGGRPLKEILEDLERRA